MFFEAEYYKILGVKSDANDAEIKKAFKKKAMELHPDKNQNDPKATEKFQELNEAYETLKDPIKRKEYDLKNKKHEKTEEKKKNTDDDIFSSFFSSREKQTYDPYEEILRNLFGFSFKSRSNQSSRPHSNNNSSSNIDTIFIGGLPLFTTEEELLSAFSQYNPFRAKVVIKSFDKPAFGFVQFLSPETMRRALRERPNIYINGKICRVNESHSNLYDNSSKRRRGGRFYF